MEGANVAEFRGSFDGIWIRCAWVGDAARRVATLRAPKRVAILTTKSSRSRRVVADKSQFEIRGWVSISTERIWVKSGSLWNEK